MANIETSYKPPHPEKPLEKIVLRTGPPDEIAEAKALIDAFRSGHEDLDKIVDELRSKKLTTKTVDEAKTDLQANPAAAEVEWFAKPDSIKASAEIAALAERMATVGQAVRDNPDWLMARAVELAYSQSAANTPEARREIHQALKKIRKHISELAPDVQQNSVSEFDSIMYGKAAPGLVEKQLSDDDEREKTNQELDEKIAEVDQDTNLTDQEKNFKKDELRRQYEGRIQFTRRGIITDPEIINYLQNIENTMYLDKDWILQSRNVSSAKDQFIRLAKIRNFPPEQVHLAVNRLNDLEQFATEQEAGKRSVGAGFATLEDLRPYLSQEVDPTTGKTSYDRLHDDPTYKREIFVQHFDPKKLLAPGEEDKFFGEFLESIFTAGRSPDRPELDDITKKNEFFRYLEWRYFDQPEVLKGKIQKYNLMWKLEPHLSMGIKQLLGPGDWKEKTKAYSLLLNYDFDYLVTYNDYSPLAVQLIEDAMFDMGAEKSLVYQQANTEFFREGGGDATAVYQLDAHGNYVMRNGQKVLIDHPISKADELLFYTKRMKKGETFDSLKIQELASLRDKVAYGVSFWDNELAPNTELEVQISSIQSFLDDVRARKAKGQTIAPWEEEQYRFFSSDAEANGLGMLERKKELLQQNRRWQQGLPEDVREMDMSPLEIETYQRLKKTLAAQGVDTAANSLAVRQAVMSARKYMIGTGRMQSIATFLTTRPALELRGKYGELFQVKSIMRSPAFEETLRTFNPDVFFDRFGMLGNAGMALRANENIHKLESKGFKFSGAEKADRALDPGPDKFRRFLHQAQQESGMWAAEMVLQSSDLMGGDFDATSWRWQEALSDQLNKQYDILLREQKVQGEGLSLGHVGLGQKIATSGGAERGVYMNEMIHRHPGKVLQLLNAQGVEAALRGSGFDTLEARRKLREAFSIVTSRVSTRPEYALKEINFIPVLNPETGKTGLEDFEAIMKPILKDELHFTDAEIQGVKTVLTNLRQVMFVDKHGAEQRTFAQVWGSDKMKLPITIMLSDADHRLAFFAASGTMSHERRGRDITAGFEKRNAELKMQTPALVISQDSTEMLKTLYEFRQAANSYASGEESERMLYEKIVKWFEFNEMRATQVGAGDLGKLFSNPFKRRFWEGAGKIGLGAATWLPFGESAMRHIAAMEIGPMDENNMLVKALNSLHVTEKDSKKKWGSRLMKWTEDFEHGFDKTKKAFARQLSEGMVYGARADANAWDAKEFDHVIDEMEKMGFFVEKPNYYYKLRKRFHATGSDQIMDIVRRYWWTLMLGAVVLAVQQAAEEEKKKH